MNYFLSALFCILLLKFLIFDTVTPLNDDKFHTNRDASNDTLIFAHIVSKVAIAKQDQCVPMMNFSLRIINSADLSPRQSQHRDDVSQ